MGLSKKVIKYLNIIKSYKLESKTIVVTGATSGIGLKTVEELLFSNAKVIMAIRNIEKGEIIKESLLKEYNNADIKLIKLDIADLSSIDEFVRYIIENKINIDGFINNAGVYNKKISYTKDGFESNIGTNYIGTYYLINKLIPYFKSLDHEVKLINTTSISYKYVKIDYEDFFKYKKFSKFKTYGISKLCILKYSLYLNEILNNTNVSLYLVHPGVTYSPLIGGAYTKIASLFSKLLKFIFMSNEKAARASILCLSNDDIEKGNLYGPTVFFDVYGKPKKNRIKKSAYKDLDKLIEYTDNLLKNA